MFEQSVEEVMKVLLLSITVGEGVKKICQAVADRLSEQEIETSCIDVYADDEKSTKRNKDNYYKLVKVVPRIARTVQHALCNYNKHIKFNKPKFIEQDIKALYDKLQIMAKGYDVIFTPVSFIAYTLQLLKQEAKISAKIVYCIPDFNIPMHADLLTDIDAVIVPCEECKNYLSKRGVKNIHVFGVPVNKKFLTKLDRAQTCKKLGVENKFTILHMCGGIGFGKTLKTIKKLNNKTNAQFIVVNGRNEKEKDNIDQWIKRKNIKNVKNYGFCNNVDELMSVSDVIVTKTGMATMIEANAKGLILANKRQLLYPEYDNMLHLIKNNAGIFTKTYSGLAKKLNDSNFADVKTNYQKLFNINADKDIAGLIKGLK